MNTKILKIVVIGLMAALCYISFMFLQIKIPTPGGFTSFHLGNTFCDVIDIDSSDYHWIYHNSEIAQDMERRKDCQDRELNLLWPYNYIEAIDQLYHQEEYSYILVVFKKEILPLLSAKRLPFTIVAPKKELKTEYKQRYIDRNNSDVYISRMLSEWDDDMKFLQNFSNVYYLDSGEHLTNFVASSCAFEVGQGYCKKMTNQAH